MTKINDLPITTPAATDRLPLQPSAGSTKSATVSSLASGFPANTLAISQTTGLQTALNDKQKIHQADIRDYGAVGDGVTDDSAAIQAAVDSVGATYGGTIYVPPGRYLCNTTITVTDVSGGGGRGIRIQAGGGMRFRDGQNGTERPGGGTLVAGTPGMSLLKLNAGVSNQAGTIIDGVHFEEKNSAHTATLVHVNVMNFVVLRDCVITGGLRGVLVDASTGDASWGMIDNCHIKDCTSGVRLTGDVGNQGTPGIRLLGGSIICYAGQVGYEIVSNCHHNQIIGTKFDLSGDSNGINIDGTANFTAVVGVNMEGPTTGSFIDVGMGTGRALGTQIVATTISGTGSPSGTGIRTHGTAGSPVAQLVLQGVHITSVTKGLWATDSSKNTFGVTTHNNTTGILLDTSAVSNKIDHQSLFDGTPITDNGAGNSQVTSYSGQVKAAASSANTIPSRTLGYSGQSASLATWENSAGSVFVQISGDGNMLSLQGGLSSDRVYMKVESGGGTMGMVRTSSQAASPGADKAKLYFRAGTNAGTLKLVVLAGASGAETTVLDNIPQT